MVCETASKPMMFDQIARSGKALTSGKRLELLDPLSQADRTVEALARATGLRVSLTSAHLQTLKQGGLVVTRKEGTRVYRPGAATTPGRATGHVHPLPGRCGR